MNLGEAPAMELVRACVDHGTEDAWREFIGRFHRVIAATVLKTCRLQGHQEFELIDDLIQETYLKIWANRCRVLRDFESQHPDAIYGFLKTVAFSVVQDHFRGKAAQKRGSGAVPLEEANAASTTDTSKDVERNLLIGEIGECLQTFGPRDRAIFWLYYRQGLTARAIAGIPAIGLSQKGVESTISRVTRHVRMEFGNNVNRQSKGKPRDVSFQLGDA